MGFRSIGATKRIAASCAAMISLVCASIGVSAAPVANADEMAQYDFVHDPSIIREGKTYYVFSTGDPDGVVGNGNIQIRTSTDLVHWRYRGTVFATVPRWITNKVGDTKNLWAPDISYYDGLYHLYYAGSSFGSNTSVIGLATNRTLDPKSPKYKWVDDGMAFQSTSDDSFNAIDPNLVMDASGHAWLAFGSFWTGIKMVQVDRHTGKPASANARVYDIAQRPDAPDAIEAPNIVYHHGYYYLFTSWDLCCRGVNSTYHTMVGRSRSVTGPYVDKAGTPLLDGGGTQFLAVTDGNMVGQGGGTVYTSGATTLIAYHYYDAKDNGSARLQIRKVLWSKEGWPLAGKPLDKSPYWS